MWDILTRNILLGTPKVVGGGGGGGLSDEQTLNEGTMRYYGNRN